MFVVDTNLLVHAANADSTEHPKAVRLVDGWIRGSETWCITWSIAYEFLRVATHRSVFPHPLRFSQAAAFLQAVLDSPSLHVLTETPHHHAVLADAIREAGELSGNLAHDLHIAVVMRENGVSEIRTADTDFHRFRFLKVVHPFQRP